MTGTVSPAVHPVATVPYVGLRPFNAGERDRFFGRERDGELLCNKILSGPLTVLYAQSGVGKSSLLRAAVIPYLEANAWRVVYFDAWAQDEPLTLLKDALIRTAQGLGVPHAGRGSPTLTELARLICSVDNRGLILVLDQFEEFLVHRGHALEHFRSELAALLRATKLDVTVVLSLREEFLAALEPLRQQILNLFTSTYRLERLRDDDLRNAIERPAAMFGGGCEPELATRLLSDLSGGRTSIPGDLRPAVELPMLQLVCQQLWEHAPNRLLTVAEYDRLGGAQQILDDYVRGLMPQRWRDQRFTARLLLYLAPPSGLKMSYSAEDLAVITGLPASRIEQELERLSAARILWTRNYRTTRYELQHDAFIPVLQSWRNHVVDRERRVTWSKRLLATSAVAAALTAAAGGFLSYRNQQEARNREQELRSREQEHRFADERKHQEDERSRQRDEDQRRQEKFVSDRQLMAAELRFKENERRQAQIAKEQEETLRRASEDSRQKLENWQTGGILDDLRSMSPIDVKSLAPGRFEVVTYYVLWHREGEQRLKQLRALLERSADLLPADYGMAPAAKSSMPGDTRWPITLAHAKSRPIDVNSFNLMWREMRDYIAANWGIPLPTEVRLTDADDLRPDQIRIKGDDADPITLLVPASDGLYMVQSTPAQLPQGPAREFIEYYASEWQRFSPESNIDYRLVPAWSVPVWKLAGAKTSNGGAIVAYLSALHLLKNPEPIFSNRAVQALLDHAAKVFPNTVAEARAASEDRLRAELTRRVRENRSALIALPQILDAVAERAADAPAAARSAGSGSATARSGGRRLTGPWPAANEAVTPQVSVGFREDAGSRIQWDLQAGLELKPPIHVYVASNLIPGWFPKGELSAALSEGLARLRREQYLSYGVNAPGFRFAPPPEGQLLSPNTILVDVHGAAPLPSVNTVRRITGPDTLLSLIDELRSTLVRTRTMWVTAETTDAVAKDLPPATREWLLKHYSLSDLKRLLRASLNPPTPTAVTGSAGPPPANVRFASWVLTSLPFWASIEDQLDEVAIGRRLATMTGKRSSGDTADVPAPVRLGLERGADALVLGNPTAAVAEFERLVKLDGAAAVSGFNDVWTRRMAAVFTTQLGRRYPSLDDLELQPWHRLDLDDMLRQARETGDRRSEWQLGVYRLAAGEEKDGQDQALRALLRQAGDVERTPEQARWLSLKFLKGYDATTADVAEVRAMNDAAALFKSAVRRLDESSALKAFTEVAALAPTNASWAYPLMTDVVNTARTAGRDSIVLEMAWRLSGEERMDRLQRSLALIDDFEKMIAAGAKSDSRHAEKVADIQFVRANARLGLQRLGLDDATAVEAALRGLLRSPRDDIQSAAYVGLAQLLVDTERFAEGETILGEARRKWPDSANPVGVLLKARLRRGDTAGMIEIARLAEQKVTSVKADAADGWLFIESLASILTRQPQRDSVVERFVATGHDYRDYIRIIAHAYGSGTSSSSSSAFQHRLTELKPSSWPGRLRNGDVSAWREMLLGRFVDDKASAGTLATVSNEAAWQQSDFAQLPMARSGQECEAWFYEAMLAKAQGQKDRMLDCLRRCVATRFAAYYEYAIAAYLLEHPD